MFNDEYDRNLRGYGNRRERRETGRSVDDWREQRAFGGDDRWRGGGTQRGPGYDEGGRYGVRDNRRFDNRDEDRRVPRDETDQLIASNKVEGTPVFDRNGDRLGSIENFMVGKRSGKVEYAVLSFGGFLGMGERHYPLPWDQLTFDERVGGYVVDVTQRDLDRAPSHRRGDDPRYDGGYARDINAYYGFGPGLGY